MTDLITNLANAIEVSPDDIMICTPHDNGYTIILTDHRKFTAVTPLIVDEPEPDPNAGAYPPNLPEHLRDVYDTPEIYTKSYLQDLAQFLEIEHAGSLRKAQLLEEINAWKESNYIPFEEE